MGRHVRNDGELERIWGNLQVEGGDGYPHTLQLEPGEDAVVIELPDDFSDPHLVEIDDSGQVIPWPEPADSEKDAGGMAELPPAVDLPGPGSGASPAPNPPPPPAPVTAPVPPGTTVEPPAGAPDNLPEG